MKIKNKILILSIIVFAGIFLNSQSAYAVPPKINPTPTDYSTGLTWKKAQTLNKPIVVNFYVDWCHFCQEFAPVLDKARKQYSLKYSFVFINCDDSKNEPLIRKFKIQGFPTLLLVDKNKKVYVDNYKLQNYQSLKQELDNFLK